MSRRWFRRLRGEEGALTAEFALVVPLLALLALGVADYGLAWRDKLAVQTAVRTGLRVGSSEGRLPSADKNLLLGLGSAINSVGLSNVAWVVVYKSVSADGAIPPACLAPAPHSVTGACNVYTGAQLAQVVAGSAPASWFGCGTSALDRSWCPTGRKTVQAEGTDQLGIWVSATHRMISGVFGPTVTVRDSAVMRLEPEES
jgi:hypothetical protein